MVGAGKIEVGTGGGKKIGIDVGVKVEKVEIGQGLVGLGDVGGFGMERLIVLEEVGGT